MRRTSTVFLLLVTLVPTLLTGRPVYHCLVTGTANLVCACEQAGVMAGVVGSERPESSAPSCCSRRESGEANPTAHDASVPRLVQSDASCCEVVIFQAGWAPISSKDSGLELCALALLPLAHAAEAVVEPQPASSERASVRSDRDPRKRPPLFLLHENYRC